MQKQDLSSALLRQALACGASGAGIASVEELKAMPSFRMMPLRPHIDRVGAVKSETGLPEGVVAWPESAKSVLVISCHHPEEDPYMDCWLDGKNPPGNVKLARILRDVKTWLQSAAPEVEAVPMPYHVERGGLWLKDAAVAAGLGVVGKNNLLVTPRFGPRVRLRAMCLSVQLPSTGPLQWDPCAACPAPCRSACPQQAFAQVIYTPADYQGLEHLPGRSGCYSLTRCDRQMAIDEANVQTGEIAVPGYGTHRSVLSYCRLCELSCPVGRDGQGA